MKPVAFALLLLIALLLGAQDTDFQPHGDQIPGPAANDPAAQKAWLQDMRQWRKEIRIRAGLDDDSQYKRPELQWTQRNFISPQAMVEDRYFYDPEARKYTVDRFLDDLDKRYGGIDSVLLWPVYPNIGIDDRSQWDLTRDLPGGIPALRKMVEDFHRRGVKVLFPAMPWDTGTRSPGVSHAVATAQLMAEIGADGINGDTFSGLPRTYRNASDETGHPVALEPELTQGDEALLWNSMNWAYWKFPFAPMAARAKWLEPRHMEQVCDRWARDKTDNLQYAFFNGVGYVSWENVWGIWNGITPRDAEALRRVAKLERFFADALLSADWEPFYPTLRPGVFSSLFPGKYGRLWTVVNRNEYSVNGKQFDIEPRPGFEYYDAWHGVKVDDPTFDLEPHGFGALLEVPAGAIDAELKTLLTQMKELSAKPLSSYSHEWEFLPQTIVEIPPAHGVHTGMTALPGGPFNFQVHGVEIEGENWIGLDVQYPWEDSPRRAHRHSMQMKPFYIDTRAVTNREFKAFVEAAHYHPADDHNFLKDWKDDENPVTWVSIEDARSYAKWAGKRLPHEWEWQYAAGNAKLQDMTGKIWQWTDEYQDEHTRAAILRGGSDFRPAGSQWYFPQNTKLDEHAKYLLMAPSKDRAGKLGFRCVVDRDE